MALSEFEMKRTESIVEEFIEKRRPPKEIRDRVDLNYRLKDQTVEIFEIRPVFKNPGKKIEMSIAKATYVRTQNVWEIYWKRANNKWVSYEPVPAVKYIIDFIEVVDKDEFGCFWG